MDSPTKARNLGPRQLGYCEMDASSGQGSLSLESRRAGLAGPSAVDSNEGVRGGNRVSPVKRSGREAARNASYIIPPISGIPAPAPAGVFSGGSATIASVV